MKRIIITAVSLFLLVFLINLIGYHELPGKKMNDTLILTSNGFKNGGEIPQKYSCDGQSISPQLSWHTNNLYLTCGGYVLIVDDPDAQKVAGKTFVHWIVLLSAKTNELPEGISLSLDQDTYPHGLKNDLGTTSYRGPCPPAISGEHTYRFTLFALKEDIKQAVESHLIPQAPFTAETFRKALGTGIVAEAQLTGRYRRK